MAVHNGRHSMLKNRVPQPMLRLLELTAWISRWVVIAAWSYMALWLLAVTLARYDGGPAAQVLSHKSSDNWIRLVWATVVLTLAHLGAAWICRSERRRASPLGSEEAERP